MGRKGQGRRTAKADVNQRKLTKHEQELAQNIDKLLRITTLPQEPNIKKALENQREISALVDRIKLLEKNNRNSDFFSSDRATAATIENFTKWVTENGGQFKGCGISEIQGFELGIKVMEPIPVSTLVISVPRSLMLTVEYANETELRELIEKDQILKNMPNVTLAVCLLYEKFRKDSFWKPYFEILPSSYSTVLYFSPEELEELKGSPTLEGALKIIKSVGRQYAYFHKMFNISDSPVCKILREKFSYEEWCWAVSTVMTRQNSIPSKDGQHMINALIPLWDLCNHTNGTITTDYEDECQRLDCFALKDFKPGEQFFIFYGARTNADLFVHNGFVYEDNVHDAYSIKLGISKSDPLYSKRVELLGKLSISPSSDFYVRKGPKPIDGKLLAFTRVFNMNEDALLHWLSGQRPSDLEYPDCAMDTDLEKKSWSFLQMRLRLLLANYATREEEQEDLEPKTDESANKKLAARMRAAEKRILREAAAYVDQYAKQ